MKFESMIEPLSQAEIQALYSTADPNPFSI